MITLRQSNEGKKKTMLWSLIQNISRNAFTVGKFLQFFTLYSPSIHNFPITVYYLDCRIRRAASLIAAKFVFFGISDKYKSTASIAA